MVQWLISGISVWVTPVHYCGVVVDLCDSCKRYWGVVADLSDSCERYWGVVDDLWDSW